MKHETKMGSIQTLLCKVHKVFKIILCKNKKDSISSATQQDQANDITKNPTETLDERIHRDATIPIVASILN